MSVDRVIYLALNSENTMYVFARAIFYRLENT